MSVAEPQAAQTSRARIESLDQFRGYTVVGMLFVNFFGGYKVIPAVLQHHNTYCSYADTIMPQFFLAVGFAFRMTFLKRLERAGPREAYGHAVVRAIGLLLLGFVVYHLDGNAKTWAELQELGIVGVLTTAFQRNYFQTLVHIAITSLWVLPVISRGIGVRVAWIIGSAVAHVVISHVWYYDFVMKRPGIDGGPLGFLTWTIPLLAGTIAYDVMALSRGKALATLAVLAVLFMGIGYALTGVDGVWDAPPFLPPNGPVDLWTMSQRSGSVTYLTFSAGFSLAVYVLFVLLCDVGTVRLGVFRTFGRNALVAYILHGMVASGVKPFVPKDAPLWYVAPGFTIYFGLTYLFVRYLEKNEIYLKL